MKKTMTKSQYVGAVWIMLTIGIVASFAFGGLYGVTGNVMMLYYMAAADWLIGVGCGIAWGRSVEVK